MNIYNINEVNFKNENVSEIKIKNENVSEINILKDVENEIILKKKKYNYEFKNNLKLKIEKIKNKKTLSEIFTLITEDTPNYIENRYGIFLYIHELEDKTYKKLEYYLNNLDNSLYC